MQAIKEGPLGSLLKAELVEKAYFNEGLQEHLVVEDNKFVIGKASNSWAHSSGPTNRMDWVIYFALKTHSLSSRAVT
jgi:hypothetical protein